MCVFIGRHPRLSLTLKAKYESERRGVNHFMNKELIQTTGL